MKRFKLAICLQFIKTTMANDPKDRINLAALQQNDPYIERIVDTAGQVALYNFNAETNEWVSDNLCQNQKGELKVIWLCRARVLRQAGLVVSVTG